MSSDDLLHEQFHELTSELLEAEEISDALKKKLERFLFQIETTINCYCQTADVHSFQFKKWTTSAKNLTMMRDLVVSQKKKKEPYVD